MKKPDLIDIYGRLIRIEYVKDLIQNEESNGEYIDREHLIKIDADLDGFDLCSTLIHECIHAISKRCGLTQAISHELEEIICEQISVFIAETFEIDFK